MNCALFQYLVCQKRLVILKICLFSEAAELVFASVKPKTTEQTMSLVASPLRRPHASPLSGIPYGDSLRLSDAAKR